MSDSVADPREEIAALLRLAPTASDEHLFNLISQLDGLCGGLPPKDRVGPAEAVVGLAEQLLGRNPGNPDYQYKYAWSLMRLCQRLGDADQRLKAEPRAGKAVEAYLAMAPTAPDYLVHKLVHDVSVVSGYLPPADAVRSVEAAVGFAEQLASRNLDNLEYRYRYAWLLVRLCERLKANREQSKAEIQARKAIPLLLGMAPAIPDHLLYDLVLQVGIASWYLPSADAIPPVQVVVGLAEQLTNKNQANLDYQDRRAWIEGVLAQHIGAARLQGWTAKVFQSLIQSDLGSGDHGNFEAVVVEGRDLVHWWRDNSKVKEKFPWQRGQVVARNVAGPGALIQSSLGSGEHDNFEVVVPVHAADGSIELCHYYHDNAQPTSDWKPGQVVARNVAGPGALIQSDFGSGHNNFEVLVQECTGSLVGYWHPNQDRNEWWLRHNVLIPPPFPSRVAPETRKIVQLTGELDREVGGQAFNHTETALSTSGQPAGIRGTDLGASFEHDGRLYFLFGDTWRKNQPPELKDLDAIAFTTDTTADTGIRLTFFDRPPIVAPLPGQQVFDQREFSVPLDGFSAGDMYVFFSTDHRDVEGTDLMGRSVLTRCTDLYRVLFAPIREFSRSKFINVSVERARVDGGDAEAIGVSPGSDVLWVWGSGRYRASDMYLACVPLGQLEDPAAVRYFAGAGWSAQEADAAPLFCGGSVGELSVRWNPYLGRYLALFNADNGILLHSAPTPWGPWSRKPVMIFDPAAGLGRFIHRRVPPPGEPPDNLGDDMFGSPRDEWGGVYGPYQITRYATGVPGEWTRLFFTMSTWNPYQVVLMTTLIPRTLLAG